MDHLKIDHRRIRHIDHRKTRHIDHLDHLQVYHLDRLDNLKVDHLYNLDPNLPSWGAVQDLNSADPTQETCTTVGHADHPTRQYELDYTNLGSIYRNEWLWAEAWNLVRVSAHRDCDRERAPVDLVLNFNRGRISPFLSFDLLQIWRHLVSLPLYSY